MDCNDIMKKRNNLLEYVTLLPTAPPPCHSKVLEGASVLGGQRSGRGVRVQRAGQDHVEGFPSQILDGRLLCALKTPVWMLSPPEERERQPMCIECSLGAKSFVNISFAEIPPPQ